MANKALATRQKMRLRVEPAPSPKPRNPVAGFAKARAAGAHAKPTASERLAAKRALKKVKLEPDEEPEAE
ncbi:hypothetical protein HAV22_06470 [Massilia sp. TW-1]|uniref:Uncharacterized protein n=1 Tax=Telluria antibiotica TaxID=2717319 RepID=A0ABX0P9H7_9BURK|nr:hypothetical protein [Telluria antibiotica]NIA53298.1 hypothetical protein [Telluria antibiotica]